VGGAFQQVRAGGPHAAATRLNDRQADAQRGGARLASRPRRPSQVPVPAAATRPTRLPGLVPARPSEVPALPGHASVADPGSQGLRATTRTPPAATPLAAPRSGPLTVQRGKAESKTKAEQYFLLKKADVDYDFVITADTAAYGRVEVFAREWEDHSLGYVKFSFEKQQQVAPPTANDPFTKEHILGRKPGILCHVEGLYNLTLTRPGPANIFSGFADTLMEKAEEIARLHGADLMYLEPAVSDIRTSPDNNARKLQDPYGYYLRLGYGDDAAARAHNVGHLRSIAQGAVPTPQQEQSYHEANTGRILVKPLR
jgi:hypothetical protein